MLQTNLTHLETAAELNELIQSQEKVAVVCGRMGPMCIPVYDVFSILEEKYTDVAFRDMYFDNPEARVIKQLPECSQFRGLPFVVYYRNGKVVKATSGIQSAKDVKDILNDVFA